MCSSALEAASAGMLLLLAAASAFDHPGATVNRISREISLKMFDCLDLLYPGLEYEDDIQNFWNRDFDISKKLHLGCLSSCAMIKMGLRKGDGELNEPSIKSFLRNNGADEYVAMSLLNMLRECHQMSRPAAKPCPVGLQSMTCFRAKVSQLNWAPKVFTIPKKNVFNG